MEACTTWECINSFANWLSAVGTILITSLALWLSVRDRRINIKSVLSLGLLPSSSPGILDNPVYVLSYTNIGPRPVTVTNHYWCLPFKKGNIFLHPYTDIKLGRLCSMPPIELTDGKEGRAFYAQDFFSKLEHPEDFLFHKNRYIAWLRIHYFKIHIVTTTGAKPRVKIHRAVRNRLWNLYRGA